MALVISVTSRDRYNSMGRGVLTGPEALVAAHRFDAAMADVLVTYSVTPRSEAMEIVKEEWRDIEEGQESLHQLEANLQVVPRVSLLDEPGLQ